MGVVCGDADVKQGGHSLRCCVQPPVLKLKGGKTVIFADMLVCFMWPMKNVVHTCTTNATRDVIVKVVF